MSWFVDISVRFHAYLGSTPISHWEKLDQAVQRGYILSTSEVAELLGTKPKGKEWTRGAFKFIRRGKIGNQAGWQVTK